MTVAPEERHAVRGRTSGRLGDASHRGLGCARRRARVRRRGKRGRKTACGWGRPCGGVGCAFVAWTQWLRRVLHVSTRRGRWRGRSGEEGIRSFRCRDSAVKRVDDVNVAFVLGLDAEPLRCFVARWGRKVGVVVSATLALVEKLPVPCDAKRVLGLLLKVVLVVRRRGVAGRSVEAPGR
eukprot:3728188-Pleurochrysis_carterae.AAC.1